MPYGECHTAFILLIRIHTRGSPHGLHTRGMPYGIHTRGMPYGIHTVDSDSDSDSDSLGGLKYGKCRFLRLNVRYLLNLRKSCLVLFN